MRFIDGGTYLQIERLENLGNPMAMYFRHLQANLRRARVAAQRGC